MMARGGDTRSSHVDGKGIYQTLSTTKMMDVRASQIIADEN